MKSTIESKEVFYMRHLSDADKDYLMKEKLLKTVDLDFGRGKPICIYSKSEKLVNAYCEINNLKGNKKSGKQCILITNLWAEEQSQAQRLISECVKYAWESGFHAAFTFFNSDAVKKVGFEPVNGFKIGQEKNPDLYGMELSWDGFKKIPRKLFYSN